MTVCKCLPCLTTLDNTESLSAPTCCSVAGPDLWPSRKQTRWWKNAIGSNKVSCYTDLVLFAESKQALLLFWYHPIFQYPLCLGEAFHERVDKAIKLFSLTRAKTKIKIRVGEVLTHQLSSVVTYQPINCYPFLISYIFADDHSFLQLKFTYGCAFYTRGLVICHDLLVNFSSQTLEWNTTTCYFQHNLLHIDSFSPKIPKI